MTFQSNDSTLLGKDIASPNACYGHKAKNLNESPNGAQNAKRIELDSLYKWVENKADVELDMVWVKDGKITSGHLATCTGMGELAGKFSLWFKDDLHQLKPGGPVEEWVELVTEPGTGRIRMPGLDSDKFGKMLPPFCRSRNL